MSYGLMTKSAAPATPAANKVEYYVDTADRRMKTLDDNGVISTLPNDGLQDRNILTNGNFAIQQKVATAATDIVGISTTTRGGVVADCWSVTASSAAAGGKWAQIDTAGAQDTGLQSRYYGSMVLSATARKMMLSQWILGSEMAHLRGKKVRVSVKINQKVGTGNTIKLGLLQLNVSGTVDTSPAFLSGAWSASTGVDPAWGTNLAAITPDASPTGENGTITGSYLNITTVATTWTRSSCVFTVPTNAKNLVVVLFHDATGGATDNVSVAEFQMTEGPDIVDFVAPPLAEEVARCQRRYCKSFPLTTVPAAAIAEATAGPIYGTQVIAGSGTALGCVVFVQFPRQMWKTPTVTLFTPVGAGATIYRLTGTTPAVQGAAAQRGLSDRGLCVTATNEATANGAVGNIVGVHYVADAEIVA